MTDFGFLSDTDDESTVEAMISQAKDLCVLEQLSVLNCAGFTDSVLPSDLDSRFRRLKSLPPPRARTIPRNPDQHCVSDANPTHSPHQNHPFVPEQSPSSPTSVSDSFPQNSFSSPSVPKTRSSSKSRSFDSPLPRDSSPPKKAGCFWCSPKKLLQRHNNKENRVLDTALGSDEYLSDLATFSLKEQQKILNQAMKEQEKINREAEKIVKWAKQASARMTFHGMEDDELSLSGDEPAK